MSVSEKTEEVLGKINQWEDKVNAYVEVLPEEARARAQQLDEQAEQNGALFGEAVAVKDLILTKEGHSRAASKMLENFQSPFDATVVKRLKQAGAIVVGKANQDEFAMGASNEFSAFGTVKNPWDLERVAGGSSGGSAVAVATGAVPFALGTDTGGSIRLPASFCNVVGLKPTYGRVSRFGVVAYASSFDQVGPIARTVEDAAKLLQVIAGQDESDLTSSPEPVGDYVSATKKDIKGLKIGVPKEYLGEDVDSKISAKVKEALSELEKQGAQIVEVSLSLMHASVPTYYLLVKAEASTNLGRYDGLRYGKLDNVEAKDLIEHYVEARGKNFGPEVKRSILMGTYVLSAGYIDAWYRQASRVRTLIRQEFEEVFKDVDVIAGPVSSELPWKIGEKADDPLSMYMADLLTDGASVAGLCGMSVPVGFVDGLPVGMQLIGPHFGEEKLFQVGGAYQRATDWHTKLPLL